MNPVMMRYRAFALLLGAAALSSCDKNAVQDITGSLPESQIRFFHFGVNAPGVNFYANDTKMTAISSASGTESTTGVVYGGVGSGGLYAGIEPGQYTFSGRIAAATDKNLPIATVATTIDGGKKNVALFYGAAHMPDIADTLELMGFEPVETEWRQAWDLTIRADQPSAADVGGLLPGVPGPVAAGGPGVRRRRREGPPCRSRTRAPRTSCAARCRFAASCAGSRY